MDAESEAREALIFARMGQKDRITDLLTDLEQDLRIGVPFGARASLEKAREALREALAHEWTFVGKSST